MLGALLKQLVSKRALIFKLKNFDYPEKTLKYKHIRRISD
jgi:hypothetical protein